MEMCKWHFQGFTEIQNGRQGPTSIFGERKNSKKYFGQFFIFNITFLATCGCAIDFFKMLSKFKNGRRSQLQKILWAQKLWNLTSEIIPI